MQTNRTVSASGFLNSIDNFASPQHEVFVQHEGTHTRGEWEQNSHQVKLQLIIIVTDNKACDKRVEAMLTPFIMDTKAKEMINLSPSYLLEGCHLGRKEASGKPAGSKRKEASQRHKGAALGKCAESQQLLPGRERASRCNCPQPAPQQLEQENPVILNSELSGHKSTTYYFSIFCSQPLTSKLSYE